MAALPVLILGINIFRDILVLETIFFLTGRTDRREVRSSGTVSCVWWPVSYRWSPTSFAS